MKKKIARNLVLALVIGLGLVLTASGSALATIINFDSLTVGDTIDGMNLGGVTINALDSGAVTQVVSDYGVGYRSPYNSITTIGGPYFLTGLGLEFIFDKVVNYVSFTGGDVGGDTDQFTVSLYDSLNNQIDSFTTPVFGGNDISVMMVDYYTVSYSGVGIKRVVVGDAINAGIGIDDLEFHQVPEPATMLLLGFGLVGLAGFGRKKFFNRV